MFPSGVDKAASFRVPWVSIAVAGLCAGAFLAASSATSPGSREGRRALDAVTAFWAGNAEQDLPPECLPWQSQLRPPAGVPGLAPSPDERQLAAERFRALCQDAEAMFSRVDMVDWGLVPARGLAHPSVATHLFIHAGAVDLAAALLFLLAFVALLETLWGHAVFLAFLLVAGMLSGTVLALVSPGSTVPVAGLGGAVAAGMGACAARLGRRRLRFTTWAGRWATLHLPGWAGVAAWVGADAAVLLAGDGVTALLAHAGMFAVGAQVAAAFKLARVEPAGLLPAAGAVDTAAQLRADLEEGAKAAGAGKLVPARLAYRRVLEADPHNMDALVALPRLSHAIADRTAVQREVERLFQELLDRRDVEDLRIAATEYASKCEFSAMRPPVQEGLARHVYDPADPLRAVALYDGASIDPNIAVRAQLRCAELLLAERKPERAASCARRLLERPGVPAEPAERARELLKQAQDLLASWAAMGIAAVTAAAAPRRAAPAPAPLTIRVANCRFTGRTDDGGFKLHTGDGEGLLMWPRDLMGVGLALVPLLAGPVAAPRLLLVVDFVLKDVAAPLGRSVVRLRSDHMGLETLFPPGTPNGQALTALLAPLAALGVALWPSPDAMHTGHYPQFSDLVSFERALHGQPLEGSTPQQAFAEPG